MAKKAKDTTAAAKKAPAAPADPAKTRDLIRLLNILALLLAIAAFLLQLFAVLSHHWKWQATSLGPLISPTYHYSQPPVQNDSRLDQQYGLYSREVKLYANNDEQLDLWASTRFPRGDDNDNEHSLDQCLSQTSTLRGAYLTCSPRVVSSEHCHCQRYGYWSFVIFFEILALILLGIALLLTALVTTQFHGILKPAAAGLSLLAFLLLFIGLILILSHLKRETRSIADTYPYLHQRLSEKLGVAAYGPQRGVRTRQTLLHQTIRRQTHDTYRAYPLLPGQHPYNETHFQEFSEQARGWVYRPYSSMNVQPVGYAPLAQRGRQPYTQPIRRTTTAASLRNAYGPLLSYDAVYDNTRAGLGWSTVLSILSMILALLLPLILIFSWLTEKKLSPTTKTTTTTTTTNVKTAYVPIPQDAPVAGSNTTRPIPTDYDHNRPITDAVVTTQHARQAPYDSHDSRNDPVIIHDVVIRDEHPVLQTTQEHSFPVNVEAHRTAYQT